VRASLFRTLEQTLVERGFDVQVQFAQAYPLRRIDHVAAQLGNIAAYEGWTVYRGVPVRADQSQGDSLFVYGLPPETRVYQPALVAGRWLQPDDTNALVVTTGLISGDRDFALGKTVTLRINGEDRPWQVVGVVEVMQPPIAPATIYASQSYLWQEEGGYGRADLVRILMSSHDSALQRELAQVAEDQFQRAGLEVQSTRNASEDRVIFTGRFNIITVILMIMAFLLATVGSLGLMGTMSINVLERRREIGVLRAIGASDHAVIRLFVVESVVISIMSWAVALLLAQVLSRVMSYAIGMNFMKAPLRYIFDLSAPVYWLAIIVVVATLASLIPARGAAQLSVRETLSYEG
jgi:putative ABC transport system permease protein